MPERYAKIEAKMQTMLAYGLSYRARNFLPTPNALLPPPSCASITPARNPAAPDTTTPTITPPATAQRVGPLLDLALPPSRSARCSVPYKQLCVPWMSEQRRGVGGARTLRQGGRGVGADSEPAWDTFQRANDSASQRGFGAFLSLLAVFHQNNTATNNVTKHSSKHHYGTKRLTP